MLWTIIIYMLMCLAVQSLQFGSKSIALQVGPESYTHELYTRDEESGDKLSYTATITQRASLSVPRKDTAGTDAALANLKQSLASFAQDKEAKQYGQSV